MSAVARVLRGTAALMLLVGLLIGVPVLLSVVAGYPLPTKTPNWDNVYWAFRQGNITSTFVIKARAWRASRVGVTQLNVSSPILTPSKISSILPIPSK